MKLRLPSRKRPRRPGWRGRLARLALVLAVVGAGFFAHSWVTLTERFEGRLWAIPSRIFSAPLELRTDETLSADQLVRRLERSGYARTESAPESEGQFRRRGSALELHLRAFAGPEGAMPARRVVVQFRGRTVAGVTDARGRGQPAVTLEPELLATVFGSRQEEREPVRLADVPDGFVAALLAAEDARFFSHHGLDLRGILRAAWTNVRSGEIVQGGSTITQQTVKNLFLDQERTWWRKVREALLAIVLDARYDKRRILEAYVNEVYMGQRGPVAICGAQAAARFYFGRDLARLTTGEWAMLAGLIRSPGRYNPFVNPERAVARRDAVLRAMARLDLVPAAEVERAIAQAPGLASGRGGYAAAPYAVDFVRAELAQLYSAQMLAEDGLRVFTTLDTRWQEHAEQALADGLDRLERQVPAVRRQAAARRLEGAVVVLRPRTGEVLALVGGRDYQRSQFNRATQARRQPGSCFKPFVYAAGFERAERGEGDGLTPATLLDDSPIERRVAGRRWSPTNYDGEYRGWVSARMALEESLNVPAVRAAELVGLERTIDLARRVGIRSTLIPVPSLALGTAEVTPLELANAYGTLARLGRYLPASIVREVADREGQTLARRRLDETQAISPEVAYLVTDVLRGVLERGTARSASALGYTGVAAGKTGTTDDLRDAWFVGYTNDLLALVWVGYDDNAKTGLTGASGALPIWVDVVARGPEPRASWAEPAEPAGIVRLEIDPESGGLASASCPTVVTEVFIAGAEPTEPCELHVGRMRRWFRRWFGRDDPPPGRPI